MTREEALLCWLYDCPGMTVTRARKLQALYGSPDAIWRELDARAQKILGEKVYGALCARRDIRVVDALTDAVERYGMHIVRKGDSCYPPLLAYIHDAPEILYVRGVRDLSDAQTFAIVGSRRCTRYGRTQAERIAGELAGMGVTVTSGMARGIDTAAHEGALRGNGRTIAVLGCGLDIAYPPENAPLMERIIAQGGSIISEYAPGTPPRSTNFPQRNRIISGMCAGTMLVEAEKGSGAMITINLALEQGREVYALPGNVDAPLSQMPLQLIAEGARMVRSAQDIVSSFDWVTPAMQLSFELDARQVNEPLELSEEEAKIVRCVENEPLSFDQIKEITQFEANELNSLLTILEIREIMKQLPGKMYTLVR